MAVDFTADELALAEVGFSRGWRGPTGLRGPGPARDAVERPPPLLAAARRAPRRRTQAERSPQPPCEERLARS
jgi:hypothetical protein